MSDFKFIAYIGDADFHDGYIDRVEQDGDTVRVSVIGYSEKRYQCEFKGVTWTDSQEPEGMMLYALAHWRDSEGHDIYDFANEVWEEDNSKLKIGAREFSFEALS